jgi:hypothetical protein
MNFPPGYEPQDCPEEEQERLEVMETAKSDEQRHEWVVLTEV